MTEIKALFKFFLTYLVAHIAALKYVFTPPRYRNSVFILRNDLLGDFFLSLPVLDALSRHYRGEGRKVVIICSSSMLDTAKRSGLFDDYIVDTSKNSSLCLLPAPKCPYLANFRWLPPGSHTQICQTRLFSESEQNPSNSVFRDTLVKDQKELFSSFRSRIAFFAFLTSCKPDIFIDMLVFSRCTPTDFCVHFTNASRKIGCAMDNIGNSKDLLPTLKIRNSFFTELVRVPFLNPLFETEKLIASRAVGRDLTFDDFKADKICEEIDSFPTGKYYIIVPGANDSRRIWPRENFFEVMKHIHAEHPDLKCVVTGVAKDSETALEAIKLMPHGIVIDMCGKTSVSQLAELIKNAEFVISNDTGSVHIANLFAKKVFAVAGLGHFGAYLPRKNISSCVTIYHMMPCAGCQWKCIFTDSETYPCIAAVTADDVILKMKQELYR